MKSSIKSLKTSGVAAGLFLSLLGCDSGEVQTQVGTVSAAESDATQKPAAEPREPEHLVHPPQAPRKAIKAVLAAGLLGREGTTRAHLGELLKAAGISEASQVLVFSKSSLQHRLISPNNPRSIYFNDDCYVGHVPDGLIEYADTDPDPEIVSGFFTIDPDLGKGATLDADRSCLACHDGSRTDGGPGFLVRSVFPDPDGRLILSAGSTVVGPDTPIDKRWGGWYVTGKSGQTHHRGNQVTIEQADGNAFINNELGSNVTDLSDHFSVKRYLQPTSDIVALMVLEHQVNMHNQLTQGSASVRKQIERSKSLAKYLGEPYDPATADTLQLVIASRSKKIVKHLLFCDEIALTDPIVGGEAFQQGFRANRHEDSQGRSLKDFDLKTRMFKYRCSYMIYSKAFETMPKLLKDAVLTQLKAVLTGEDDDPDYAHLGDHERAAILHILHETVDGFDA